MNQTKINRLAENRFIGTYFPFHSEEVHMCAWRTVKANVWVILSWLLNSGFIKKHEKPTDIEVAADDECFILDMEYLLNNHSRFSVITPYIMINGILTECSYILIRRMVLGFSLRESQTDVFVLVDTTSTPKRATVPVNITDEDGRAIELKAIDIKDLDIQSLWQLSHNLGYMALDLVRYSSGG